MSCVYKKKHKAKFLFMFAISSKFYAPTISFTTFHSLVLIKFFFISSIVVETDVDDCYPSIKFSFTLHTREASGLLNIDLDVSIYCGVSSLSNVGAIHFAFPFFASCLWDERRADVWNSF